MLIPSSTDVMDNYTTSLSRRVNANSQRESGTPLYFVKSVFRV